MYSSCAGPASTAYSLISLVHRCRSRSNLCNSESSSAAGRRLIQASRRCLIELIYSVDTESTLACWFSAVKKLSNFKAGVRTFSTVGVISWCQLDIVIVVSASCVIRNCTITPQIIHVVQGPNLFLDLNSKLYCPRWYIK